jgi:hypothetical protein
MSSEHNPSVPSGATVTTIEQDDAATQSNLAAEQLVFDRLRVSNPPTAEELKAAFIRNTDTLKNFRDGYIEVDTLSEVELLENIELIFQIAHKLGLDVVDEQPSTDQVEDKKYKPEWNGPANIEPTQVGRNLGLVSISGLEDQNVGPSALRPRHRSNGGLVVDLVPEGDNWFVIAKDPHNRQNYKIPVTEETADEVFNHPFVYGSENKAHKVEIPEYSGPGRELSAEAHPGGFIVRLIWESDSEPLTLIIHNPVNSATINVPVAYVDAGEALNDPFRYVRGKKDFEEEIKTLYQAAS